MTRPNPPEKVESLVERAGRQIDLGRRMGADGGGVSPSNIYVIATELVARILALEAQVAGMAGALQAMIACSEDYLASGSDLAKIVKEGMWRDEITKSKARLAAAKEPS